MSSSYLITGVNGQLGRALRRLYPDAKATSRNELDVTDEASLSSFDWNSIDTILNCAAYTNVDGAETPEGRIAAWQINAVAPAYLAGIANKHDLRLVHISSDYVFDGTKEIHDEHEPYSPLGVYGSSKAAGDIAASQADKHYIFRSSWVIGDGKNFVRTMLSLGEKGVDPAVVGDQIGRLSFTSELVRAIDHMLSSGADYGTYNCSNDGPASSWADIASQTFAAARLGSAVTPTTTAEYFAARPDIAPRPLNSMLDLSKLQATGFSPRDWQQDLVAYVKQELAA